jgi:hypothetical protein
MSQSVYNVSYFVLLFIVYTKYQIAATMSIFDDGNTTTTTPPQYDKQYNAFTRYVRHTIVPNTHNNSTDSCANASILSLASVKFDRQPAQVWPCQHCGLPLGIVHIVVGVMLVVFDVCTNTVTSNPFAITSGWYIYTHTPHTSRHTNDNRWYVNPNRECTI